MHNLNHKSFNQVETLKNYGGAVHLLFQAFIVLQAAAGKSFHTTLPQIPSSSD